MSQISSVIPGNPPFVGPVLTLTGDNAVAVSPTAGTIFIAGAPADLISTSGDALTHTITVELKNQLQGTVQTVDNTPTTVPGITIPMAPNSGLYVIASFACANDTYTAIRTGSAATSALKQGANPTVLTQPVVSYSSPRIPGFFPLINFGLNLGSIQVIVTGEAATTINWRVHVNYFYL